MNRVRAKGMLVGLALALGVAFAAVAAQQTGPSTSSSHLPVGQGSPAVVVSDICAPTYTQPVAAPPPSCTLSRSYPIGTPCMCGSRKGTIVKS